MQKIRSLNWALGWRRFLWTAVWAAMMALLVIMCQELAASQPVIFGIVMLAAVVGSIGLAYMRVSWQNGAHATAVAAFVVAALAICTHAFMEASYWSSVIDQINQEVSSERAVNDARAIVAEKRKERYAASSSGKSAAQIEAEIEAKKQDRLWSATEQCTTATASNSRGFCESYHLLKAQLAAAVEASKLEGVVWSAGTTIEGTTKRNLAAIAILASKTLGGNPEQYTGIIVITLVLFTQTLLAFALLIGWAPEKPRFAPGAARAVPATPVATAPFSPASEPLRKPEAPSKSEVAEKAPAPLPQPASAPASDAKPEAKATIAKSAIVPVTPPSPKVGQLATADILAFPKAGKRGKGKKREGLVKQWLEDCTSQVDDPKIKATSKECRSSYVAWCSTRNAQPVGQKVMSRQIGVILGRSKGERGRSSRNAHGNVYPGLLVFHPAQDALRA